MTTTTDRTVPSAIRRNWPPFAVGSAGIALVLTAIGTFWSPLASYEATQTLEDLRNYLVIVPVIAIAAAIVFGLVVRRAPDTGADVRAIVLAVLSVLTIVVFWTGLPVVLAAGAACLALSGSTRRGTAGVVLVLAALVTIAAVWLALAG